MKGAQTGFTLIELIVVIVILSLLAAAAIPRFLDLEDDAIAAAFDGTVGALRSGVTMARAGYMTDNTEGLPPDDDSNNWPDHLGDLAETEPTFFDGVLETPVPPAPAGRKGWKSQPGWLPSGTNYFYYYDADGDDLYNVAVDKRFFYDPTNGTITVQAGGF
jgi:prepilin-type N-terminal cleavage/methylation domain-containing protein